MLLAEFQMDSPLLKEALDRAPDVVVRDEERYHCGEATHYYFWAEGGDLDRFEAGLTADPTVTDVRSIGESDGRRLYRATTTDREPERSPVATWCELDVVLLEASGSHEGWTMRMRFPDRDTLVRYRRLHAERDLPFRLRSIRNGAGPPTTAESGLTAAQAEALRATYDAGYFDVPRSASQSDVAAELGISSQSLSERIRRGTAALVETTLVGPSHPT